MLILLSFTTACGSSSPARSNEVDASVAKDLNGGGDTRGSLEDMGNGILLQTQVPPVTVTGDGVLASHTKIVSEEALWHSTIGPNVIHIPAEDVPLLPDLKVGDVMRCAAKGDPRRCR